MTRDNVSDETIKLMLESPAVSIKHLSKTYTTPLVRLKRLLGRRVKPPVQALLDVSFDVHDGEIFGLIGRNGAGKTTLTKIVATLVQPSSGTITVKGFDSVRDEERVRARVGLATAEERSFYWRLTARQNLLFFARLHGLSDEQARRRISELFAQFELEEVSNRRFGELSTGNKQRLAFARAMLASPPVLLLDEPTRSLDPLAAARMRELIRRLAQSDPPASILLISHNLTEVEQLCQRVAVISRGRIRALDTPQGLRASHENGDLLRLTVSGISLEQLQRVPGAMMNQAPKDLEVTEHDERLIITLRHGPTVGPSLDRVMHGIIESGGRILAMETEQATLLDVLESYEREPEQGKGEAA